MMCGLVGTDVVLLGCLVSICGQGVWLVLQNKLRGWKVEQIASECWCFFYLR